MDARRVYEIKEKITAYSSENVVYKSHQDYINKISTILNNVVDEHYVDGDFDEKLGVLLGFARIFNTLQLSVGKDTDELKNFNDSSKDLLITIMYLQFGIINSKNQFQFKSAVVDVESSLINSNLERIQKVFPVLYPLLLELRDKDLKPNNLKTITQKYRIEENWDKYCEELLLLYTTYVSPNSNIIHIGKAYEWNDWSNPTSPTFSSLFLEYLNEDNSFGLREKFVLEVTKNIDNKYKLKSATLTSLLNIPLITYHALHNESIFKICANSESEIKNLAEYIVSNDENTERFLCCLIEDIVSINKEQVNQVLSAILEHFDKTGLGTRYLALLMNTVIENNLDVDYHPNLNNIYLLKTIDGDDKYERLINYIICKYDKLKDNYNFTKVDISNEFDRNPEMAIKVFKRIWENAVDTDKVGIAVELFSKIEPNQSITIGIKTLKNKSGLLKLPYHVCNKLKDVLFECIENDNNIQSLLNEYTIKLKRNGYVDDSLLIKKYLKEIIEKTTETEIKEEVKNDNSRSL